MDDYNTHQEQGIRETLTELCLQQYQGNTKTQEERWEGGYCIETLQFLSQGHTLGSLET